MLKIKDRITLGAISALLSQGPFRCLNALEHRMGLTDIKYSEMESSIFLPDNKVTIKEGRIISMFTNSVASGIGGIMLTYILSITGKDHPIIKGGGFGALLWVLMYGVAPKLGILKKSKKPMSPIYSFFDHVAIGAICGYLITIIGDDSLFPSHQEDK